MLHEKREREAKEAARFEEDLKKRQGQGNSSLPSLGGQKQMFQFDDIDINEDDDAEVIEEKNQKKVLKEKISSVNNRLGQVDKIVVTKGKIEALIKKFQHTKKSANYHSMS